tara:strand:+ start:76 stop:576 length:501 start_codon:yes stop_codon:yes gene_type:complete
MAFNTNTAQGTVVYTSGEWKTGSVLANDLALVSNTTLTAIPSLSIPVAKYERVAFRLWLDVDNKAAGDFSWSLTVPASATSFRARRVTPEIPISGDITEKVTFETTGTGIGAQDAVGTDSAYYIQLEGVFQNGANIGAIDIKVAQKTSSATATTVKGGSYVEYQRF